MDNKDNGIIKESVVSGHCKPIGKTELINLFEMGENSMVKIFSKEKNGSGFICKIKDKELNFSYALFTNNHVLGEEELQEGEKISFEYKNKYRYIKLNGDRRIFTDTELDYTCIEIKQNDNFEDFFLIDQDILSGNYSQYKNEDLIILQFPHGNEISFAQGKIKEINDDKIFYSTSTEEGSSGSPLIIRKNIQKYYVIGIHYGAKKDKNYNLGRPMKCIFNDIKKKIKIKITKEENIVNDNEDKIKENQKENKDINDNEEKNILKKDIIIGKSISKNVILENNEEKSIKNKKDLNMNIEEESLIDDNDENKNYKEKTKSYIDNLNIFQNLNDIQIYKKISDFEVDSGFAISLSPFGLEERNFLEIFLDKEYYWAEDIIIYFKFKDKFFSMYFTKNPQISQKPSSVCIYPIAIIHLPINNKDSFSSIPDYIKSIRDRRFDELILIFNAYGLENKRVISQKEEEQLAKEEGIKYLFEISSKEDVELLLKKIACLCMKNKKEHRNQNLTAKNSKQLDIKNKKIDCISF